MPDGVLLLCFTITVLQGMLGTLITAMQAGSRACCAGRIYCQVKVLMYLPGASRSSSPVMDDTSKTAPATSASNNPA